MDPRLPASSGPPTQAVVHPYIVTLRFSFQTPSKLYLVLDFINGGHLFFNLYRAVCSPPKHCRRGRDSWFACLFGQLQQSGGPAA